MPSYNSSDYKTEFGDMNLGSVDLLLHSIKSNRNWSAALGSLRLLGQISHTIQDRLENERKKNKFQLTEATQKD